MKILNQYVLNRKSGLPFFLLYLFLNSPCFAFFITYSDSTKHNFTSKNKSKFDINDPRNPDCPCHLYQKIADDEFRKLSGNTSIESPKGNGLSDDKIKNNHFVFFNAKHFKKQLKSTFSFSKKKKSKRRKRFWFKKDISSCFRW